MNALPPFARLPGFARHGHLVRKGFVHEGKLDATATMLRQGKPPVENWVVAGAKP